MYVRVYGDIENNIKLQHFILATFHKPKIQNITYNVFLGDILCPNYGTLSNEKFFTKLYSYINIDFTINSHVRCKDVFNNENIIESYEKLLRTLLQYSAEHNNKNLKLHKYKWDDKNFKFRTHFNKHMHIITYSDTIPKNIFILGNKEVQAVVDIYNSLLNNTCSLKPCTLEKIYNYINHCVDYVIINNVLFIHNERNKDILKEDFKYTISGHMHNYYIKKNISVLDTSNIDNVDDFVTYFIL